jgi:MYXO-CTERM domain-containing protein
VGSGSGTGGGEGDAAASDDGCDCDCAVGAERGPRGGALASFILVGLAALRRRARRR